MNKLPFAAVLVLFSSTCLRAQSPQSETAQSSLPPPRITVRAILVDKDLNQHPVPHLTVVASTGLPDPDASFRVKTDFSGNAEILAPPGRYRLFTPDGVDFQAHHYAWSVEITVAGDPVSIDLSNDNARITPAPFVDPARKIDDLTFFFQKYQKSVVTVWSEIGSGTGFIVDSAGLVMTNQHVIGPSDLVSVQFDAKHKVTAQVLAIDSERDVAVLYANLSAFPGAAAAPVATRADGPLAVEGEKVFTIGSPLGLKKIITSGIVSKVEARAIISDVNINHGNSGGPLFNLQGQVIGITTFLVPGGNGPGVAGVVRIDQAQGLLQQARKKMDDTELPSARLLPVEPSDPYPLAALEKMSKPGGFDRKPYILSVGGFDVALGTPVLQYEIQAEAGHAAAQERNKRIKKRGAERSQNTFEPLQDLHEWAEYTGGYKPVLLVQAAPQLRETFASALGRELVPSIQLIGAAAPRMRFRTDFRRMKLYCGDTEVEPIQPGKAATVVNAHSAFVNASDATYVGIYSYPPDAVSPSCGSVSLRIFSEKDPDKPETKLLDAKTVQRVWNDFRPYLAVLGAAANEAPQ